MNDAKLANAGVIYRRQFAFASLDLALHDPAPRRRARYDCVGDFESDSRKVFLPIDPSTTFVSYFGHLNGYDGGYYGYARADAIAADSWPPFSKSVSDGYLDRQAGSTIASRNLRTRAIARDVNVIRFEKFLGSQTIDSTVLEKDRDSMHRTRRRRSSPATGVSPTRHFSPMSGICGATEENSTRIDPLS